MRRCTASNRKVETTLHIQTAKRFVEASVNLYDEGFHLAAGEMIWGATIQAVCALAHIDSKDHPSSIGGNRERYAIIRDIANGPQTSDANLSYVIVEDTAREIIVGTLHDRFNSGNSVKEPDTEFHRAWESGLEFSEGLIEAAEQGLLGKS